MHGCPFFLVEEAHEPVPARTGKCPARAGAIVFTQPFFTGTIYLAYQELREKDLVETPDANERSRRPDRCTPRSPRYTST